MPPALEDAWLLLHLAEGETKEEGAGSKNEAGTTPTREADLEEAMTNVQLWYQELLGD